MLRKFKIVPALLTGVFLISCTQRFGEKYEAGKHIEVYYKDRVDPKTAKKVGDFLARNFPSTTRKSFQLTELRDTIHFKMVVDPAKAKEVADQPFQALGMLVSDSALDGRPVVIELTNAQFHTIRAVPFHKINP